jgi:hypothetical protein
MIAGFCALQAEALRKTQAAVLRVILAEIAAQRRKRVEGSEEQR